MIYKHKKSKEILECLSLVHPVSLDIVPEEMILRLEKEYDTYITHLSNTFKQSRTDILRLLLVLQCSSFHSGIYLHYSMFNHSCRPNAIKFQPEDSPISQIRATRIIEKGEEITISYIDPTEQTYSARSRILTFQFGIPVVPKDQKDIILEGFLKKEADELDNQKFVEDFEKKLNELSEEVELKELLELSQQAQKYLDPRHILLLRLNRCILKTVAPKLQEGNQEEADNENNNFKLNLEIFVKTAYEVYQTQIYYLSRDHIDFATTYKDLSMGIESWLSFDRVAFFQIFPQWGNLNNATKMINFCEKSFQRISKLYE